MGTWESVTSYDGITERLEAASPLRLLLLPPLMHGAAQWAVFRTMAQGSTIILPDNPRRLDPDDVWRTVEREKANVIDGRGRCRPAPARHAARQGRVRPLVPRSPWATAGRR